jgi:DNA-directed RNA polymerase subunit RPC12/RpoP
LGDEPLEVRMECLICGTESIDHPTRYDGKEIGCPECGRYVISGSLIASMNGYALVINEARAELDRMRDRDEVPILTTTNTRLHRLSS